MRKLSDYKKGKRYPVSFRTTDAMRDKIRAMAEASGRSVAQEIEFQIEMQYAVEDALRARL